MPDPAATQDHHRPTAGVWAALGAIYVVWGATYLAIRVGVETLPPFLMASVRFLIAGALLYAFAVRRGDRRGDRPTARQWRAAAIIGTSLLLGGNGLVTLAEQRVASGIAALLVATVPLWMVLLARVVLKERVGVREVVGIAVGFGGLALLVGPSGGGGRIDPFGVVALVVASLSWAAGSLYARRAPLPSRPLVGIAMEMVAGGVALGIAGLAAGEAGRFDPAAVSLPSTLALGYLIVGGSWIGFACYAWLLRVARTSLVSTYAYVNPVVAVLLGWAFLSEPVGPRTLVAGGIIVLAVALIVSAQARRPAPTSPDGQVSGRRGEAEVPGQPAAGAPPEGIEEIRT